MTSWIRKRPRRNKANFRTNGSERGPARLPVPLATAIVRNKANLRWFREKIKVLGCEGGRRRAWTPNPRRDHLRRQYERAGGAGASAPNKANSRARCGGRGPWTTIVQNEANLSPAVREWTRAGRLGAPAGVDCAKRSQFEEESQVRSVKCQVRMGVANVRNKANSRTDGNGQRPAWPPEPPVGANRTKRSQFPASGRPDGSGTDKCERSAAIGRRMPATPRTTGTWFIACLGRFGAIECG